MEIEFVFASCLAVLLSRELFIMIDELDRETDPVVACNVGYVHLRVCEEVKFVCLSKRAPLPRSIPLE